MAAVRQGETNFGGIVGRNLRAVHCEEDNIYENENSVAARTVNTAVVQQNRPPQNDDQNRRETKKNGLKWLIFAVVVAAVIITGVFAAVFVMLKTLGNDQHTKDQQTMTRLENLEKNLTTQHNKDQQTKTLIENLGNNLTSLFNDIHGENQKTKILLENLKINLTSRINKVHGENQKTKILLENLKINLTSRINKVDLLTIGKIVDQWYLASDWLLYKLFNERANYNTAKSRCEYFGGTLLAKGLRNASVLRELEENVLRTSVLKVWIGYYEPVEGSWIWLDGGVNNTEVVVWSEGEPNNNGGINEACGDMLRIHQSKAEINDDICSDKFPFVCERYF